MRVLSRPGDGFVELGAVLHMRDATGPDIAPAYRPGVPPIQQQRRFAIVTRRLVAAASPPGTFMPVAAALRITGCHRLRLANHPPIGLAYIGTLRSPRQLAALAEPSAPPSG